MRCISAHSGFHGNGHFFFFFFFFFFLLANARRVLPFWGCFGNGLGNGILSFVPSHPNFCYKVIRIAIDVNILDLSGI